MTELTERLMEIRGVGEATAESIVEVLEEEAHHVEQPKLQKAIKKANAGEDREAAIWLRRYDRSKD